MALKLSLPFLDIVIDTDKVVIRILNEKNNYIGKILLEMLQKTKTTLRELQSLVGTLYFCAKAIPSARVFNKSFVMLCVELNIQVILLE